MKKIAKRKRNFKLELNILKEAYRSDLRIRKVIGTSLVIQWLRLWASNAGGLGLIPGQGTRSHAATKTWSNEINKREKR